jgi:glycosyltransferase involved in cell wall biosynthesis
VIITISNLYPRPDQKTRGMFNFQLFSEMGKWLSVNGYQLSVNGYRATTHNQQPITNNHCDYLNLCLVPEWRIWRWGVIRKWQAPGLPSGSDTQSQASDSTRYVPVFYLPFIGRSLSWWFYYRAIGRVVNGYSLSVIGRQSKTDNSEPLTTSPVLLASWLYPDAVAAARVAKQHGFPVWLRLHGSDRFHLNSKFRRKLILEAADYAKGVICNCNSVAEVLIKHGIPKSKIHIVRNGVDTSLFRMRNEEETIDQRGEETIDLRPKTIDQGVGGETIDHRPQTPESFRSNVHGLKSNVYGLRSTVSSSSPLILFIANLVPVKGPDIMLKAFAGVVKGYSLPVISEKTNNQSPITDNQSPITDNQSPITNNHPLPLLVIIGSGPLRKQLERLAGRLGIADRVHFLGNRPHKEVALWMNRADCLCLTSRSEGMPNVVLESLASGLPVVATRVGACPELLDGEPAARLCPSEDVEAISAALSDLLASGVNRQELSAKYAASNSWSKQAETILKLVGMGE